MRILTVGNMYPPHHQGGYEQDWAAGVAALRGAGHEVEVLVSDHREPGVADVEEVGVHRKLRWYWHEHEFPRRPLRVCLAIERHNAEVFARFQPDLVSWWPMGGLSIGLIEQARRRNLPAIGVVYDDWMVYGPNVDGWQRRRIHRGGLTERLTGLPARAEIGPAARWLFASDSVRSAARGAVADLRDTGLLAPGLDEVFLSAAPARDEWRWQLLAPGRLDPRKGLHTAVEALALLPEATFTIIGGGDDRHAAELRELAQQRGVGDRFRIEPPRPRPELARAYADCDAVVFPVEWAEPFGLVPLEAMGIGRPVVATGRGGSGEFLRDGENSLLFEPGRAEALATALKRLAGEAELRDRLRTGGFETAPAFGRSRWNKCVVAEHEARVG
jgi:glycogen synthase